MTVSFFSDAYGTKLLEKCFSAATNPTSGAIEGVTSTYNFVDNTTYYVMATLVNDKYTRSTPVLAFTVKVDAGTDTHTLDFETGDGFDQGKWGPYIPTPEPTSGLLLLLGAATLALRRRSR